MSFLTNCSLNPNRQNIWHIYYIYLILILSWWSGYMDLVIVIRVLITCFSSRIPLLLLSQWGYLRKYGIAPLKFFQDPIRDPLINPKKGDGQIHQSNKNLSASVFQRPNVGKRTCREAQNNASVQRLIMGGDLQPQNSTKVMRSEFFSPY